MSRRLTLVTVASSLAALGANAQQVTIPVRPLGATQAASAAIFKTITNVRPLSDGRVLVNDALGREIVMLDATLAAPKVLIDSTAGKNNSYGPGSGGLLAYLADSTLFVDGAAQAFVVMDPAGKIARVTPLSGRSTYIYLTASSPLYGFPGTSSALGLVYELPAAVPLPRRPAPGDPDVNILVRDTNVIAAFNMITRKTDTLGRLTTGRGTMEHITSAGLKSDLPTPWTTALHVSDGWAVLTDGSVALVRGRDYRIDWINPDGTRTSSARVAHDWQHYADDDKVHLADSLNLTVKRLDSTAMANWRADSVAYAAGKGDSIRAARAKQAIALLLANGESPAMVEAFAKVESTPRPLGPPPNPRTRVQPTEIPDYMPALDILSGSVRGDADNNIWVRARQITPYPDGTVYDIVNRQGVLIDRVAVPTSKTIVGFAPGGIIYVMSHDGGAARLERAKWK